MNARILLTLHALALAALAQVPPPPQPQPVVDPRALVLTFDKAHLLNAAFLQQGKTLATYASDGKLYLWDVERGTRRGEPVLVGHPTNDHAFQFLEHPDGKRLVLAGNFHKAYVIALEDGKILREIAAPDLLYPVSHALLDKGATLVRFDRSLRWTHFDIETGKAKEGPNAPPPAKEKEIPTSARLALAPDGKTYALNTGVPEVRDAATHAVRYTLKANGKRQLFYRNGVYTPRYSADGSRVALHGTDGTLRIVETATGKEIQVLEMEERDPMRPGNRRIIAPVAFAPDGQWILVTTEDKFGELLLHGVTSGLEVRRFPARTVGPRTTSIALSDVGNLLVIPGNAYDRIEVWDMAKGEIKLRP